MFVMVINKGTIHGRRLRLEAGGGAAGLGGGNRSMRGWGGDGETKGMDWKGAGGGRRG